MSGIAEVAHDFNRAGEQRRTSTDQAKTDKDILESAKIGNMGVHVLFIYLSIIIEFTFKSSASYILICLF